MQEEEIISRINTLCASRNWTIYRLAKESGITYSTLCTMLHNATAPSFHTLVRLCEGFGITLSEFFDVNNDLAALPSEQRNHLQQWNKLNPENQRALEQYIAYLLQQQNKNGRDEP